MSQAVAVGSFAVRVATRIRCRVGIHAWSTWGVPRLVDVRWNSPALLKRRGWNSSDADATQGLLQHHAAQDRVCLACRRRQRHYFWSSPEMKKSALEYGGGGYVFGAYRDAVACGLFAGPQPAGLETARLDDAVLPMFKNAEWPEPVPALLACRLGLYHIRRHNPEPRFQYERICPFCHEVFWL